MKVCVPEELKRSEQVKKVWSELYLRSVKPNRWLNRGDAEGEGSMGPPWGLCAAWDRGTAVFRKKHKSAACLKEHDPRRARAGIAEQLLGFIWEGCSWLSCSRVVCYSALAPWPQKEPALAVPCRTRCTWAGGWCGESSSSCCTWGQKEAVRDPQTSGTNMLGAIRYQNLSTSIVGPYTSSREQAPHRAGPKRGSAWDASFPSHQQSSVFTAEVRIILCLPFSEHVENSKPVTWLEMLSAVTLVGKSPLQRFDFPVVVAHSRSSFTRWWDGIVLYSGSSIAGQVLAEKLDTWWRMKFIPPCGCMAQAGGWPQRMLGQVAHTTQPGRNALSKPT